MADKKKKKGTGLQAPAIGSISPKGSTIKRDKNGRITVIPPKKKK